MIEDSERRARLLRVEPEATHEAPISLSASAAVTASHTSMRLCLANVLAGVIADHPPFLPSKPTPSFLPTVGSKASVRFRTS